MIVNVMASLSSKALAYDSEYAIVYFRAPRYAMNNHFFVQ